MKIVMEYKVKQGRYPRDVHRGHYAQLQPQELKRWVVKVRDVAEQGEAVVLGGDSDVSRGP